MKYCLPTLALVAGLSALAAGSARAQTEPVKFGKVDAKEFDQTAFVGDSTASAVVLCDYGTSRVVGADDGFKIVFERVTRILVLTKAGYEHATVEIPLYRRESDEEQLQQLRACTYNLVNGRVEKQAFDPKTVFSEQLDAHRTRRKFTLPGVREGSIIEYAYTIKSDFLFNLQDWRFQGDIPVQWSEYRAVVPSFLQYKQLFRGFHPYAVKDAAIVPYQTSYRASVKDAYGLSSVNSNSSLITGQAVSYRWAMQRVPAFRAEPFMTTARDYLAGVDFELDKIQFDPNHPQQVTSSWEKITADLLKHEHFGAWIGGRTALSEAAEALATGLPDPAARAAAVVALVQRAVQYTGEARLYAANPVRRVLEQQRGNAAEINLLLLRTLRDAGLTAHPVLVSTRTHGRVYTELPLLSQFNYVLAQVELPGDQAPLLLDATEPVATAGTLPLRCLNGQGRLLAPAGRWVALRPAQKHTRLTTARFSLDAQGQLRGSLHREYAGYAGLAERTRLAEQGEKGYLGAQHQQYADWQVTRAAVGQSAELSKPLLLDLDLTLPAAGAGGAERVYLPLMQFFTDRQNPFQPATRLYPVDFGAAREDVATVTLTLPPGYAVEELPKRLMLNLPNDAGRFAFDATLQGQVLQLTSRLTLHKTEYLPSEYAALRELYTRALAKHTEPLVLRRGQ